MIIKLKSVTNDQLGSKPAKLIVGTRIDDGQEWSRKIFADNQELMKGLSEVGIGEFADIKLRRDGKWWNPVSIAVADPKVVAAVKEKIGISPAQMTSTRDIEWRKHSTDKPSKEPGTTPYKWNGRTGEAYDRSSAIYLAWEVFKATNTEAAMKKLTSANVLAEVFPIAEDIFDYIHAGESYTPEEDALEPPDVD